ncbi:MAG: DnaA/Hda family protein [bacterium]
MKDTIRAISDVASVVDWDNKPTEGWKCEVCGFVNDNWLPTVNQMFGSSGEQWRQGICKACEAKDLRIEQETKANEVKEKRRARILALHTQAGLPKEHATVKFADLTRVRGAEEAFDELSNIDPANDRTWLCLYGDNNTGKSKLLAAASNRQNGGLIPTLYINESLFFKQIKESWETNDESRVMNVFKLAEVVMWDEFSFFDFMEKSWIYERVYALLEELAEMDKKVIFATNVMNIRKRAGQGVDTMSIEGRCGKRIWARLQRRNTRYIQMRNEPFF